MSQIRKAHSNEVIDRRLRTLEVEGNRDAMELIGLHDELTRVERKWKEKAAGEHQPANVKRKRPLANAAHIDQRFERLTRLVDAALRAGVADANERAYLERIAAELHARQPVASNE